MDAVSYTHLDVYKRQVLSRASELAGLREQLGSLKSSLAEAARRAEDLGRDLQKAQYELDVAQDQHRAAQQQVLALETREQDVYKRQPWRRRAAPGR